MDLKSGRDCPPPSQWASKRAAELAAAGTGNFGRWVGDLTVSLALTEDARLSELGREVRPAAGRRERRWDQDGMYTCQAGQVRSLTVAGVSIGMQGGAVRRLVCPRSSSLIVYLQVPAARLEAWVNEGLLIPTDEAQVRPYSCPTRTEIATAAVG